MRKFDLIFSLLLFSFGMGLFVLSFQLNEENRSSRFNPSILINDFYTKMNGIINDELNVLNKWSEFIFGNNDIYEGFCSFFPKVNGANKMCMFES